MCLVRSSPTRACVCSRSASTRFCATSAAYGRGSWWICCRSPCAIERPALQKCLTDSSCGRSIRSMSTVDRPPEELEFLPGTLEVLILRSLKIAPNHAYGIAQFLKQQSAEEFVVDNGS